VACLTLWPILLSAGTLGPVANLSATEAALAEHSRNFWNCRKGLNSCDHSKLSEAETIAVAVASYDRNVSSCKDGITPCDHSRLTSS
jgi:hypothetical protein